MQHHQSIKKERTVCQSLLCLDLGWLIVCRCCCGCRCRCGWCVRVCGVVWCVVCGVTPLKKPVCTSKTSPCVPATRPHVCGGRYPRGRCERTHGEGNHRQFCLPKFAHLGLSRAPEVPQRNPWMLPIFSFRIREQHDAESSIYSLHVYTHSATQHNTTQHSTAQHSTEHATQKQMKRGEEMKETKREREM